VPHADFFQAAPVSSNEIALNDAKIVLTRESIGVESLRARVVMGGQISARKGITFAASNYRQEELSGKDRAILDQTRHFPFVRYAISYLRDAVEMRKYRAHFGDTAYLIAKLERQSAVDEAQRIAVIADELWLCRGDLGANWVCEQWLKPCTLFRQIAMPIPALLGTGVGAHDRAPYPNAVGVCFSRNTTGGYRGFVLSIKRHQPYQELPPSAALFRD
jgi:pyruvate kinase